MYGFREFDQIMDRDILTKGGKVQVNVAPDMRQQNKN